MKSQMQIRFEGFTHLLRKQQKSMKMQERQLQILSVQQIHQKSYLQEMQLKDLILPHTAFHR